ncbi:MAG: phosphatidylglycerophosphatase A [Saprospiraceae bacterium]|nr:phosphatidylglycerophosphatase A [Saprospiraceae bacterium]
MLFHKVIASFFGLGYFGKGAGTVAAGVAAFILFFLFSNKGVAEYLLPVLSLFIILLGTWSSSKLLAVWGKDPQKVVIDEVAGIMVSLVFIPVSWSLYLAGFVLFRFFDIYKPLGIRKVEKLPGAWGVMADDILAGVYSNILVQLYIHC